MGYTPFIDPNQVVGKFRYTILVDGNGMFYVRRQAASWWVRVFPDWSENRETYAYQEMKNLQREGMNPSPERYWQPTGHYFWVPKDRMTKFETSHEAAKALVYLQERDERRVRAQRETVVIEEIR